MDGLTQYYVLKHELIDSEKKPNYGLFELSSGGIFYQIPGISALVEGASPSQLARGVGLYYSDKLKQVATLPFGISFFRPENIPELVIAGTVVSTFSELDHHEKFEFIRTLDDTVQSEFGFFKKSITSPIKGKIF